MSKKQANSPGLFDAAKLFRRRFHFVALGTLVGVGLAGAYFWTSETIYESSTRILLVNPHELPGPNGEPSREETTVADEQLATQTMIIESPELIEAALERDGLKNLESIQNSLDEDQDEVEYIVENLRVVRGGEGQGRSAHVITLRLHHNSPEDCAAILKSIVLSYEEFNRNTLATRVHPAFEALQEDRDEAKQELDASRTAYVDFRKATPELLGSQSDRINTHRAQVDRWSLALAEIRARKIETECRIETVRKMFSQEVQRDEFGFDRVELLQKMNSDSAAPGSILGNSAGSVVSAKSGRPEMAEAAKAEINEMWQMMLRERDLLEQYGADHPLVQRTRAGIEKMKELLASKRKQMERDFLQMLVSDLEELNSLETAVAKFLDDSTNAAQALVQAELEDERFQADLLHKQHLYNTAIDRLGEVDTSRNRGGLITKTIARVKVGEPIAPKPAIIMAMGVVIGLFMGMGLAVVADHLAAGAADEAEVRVNRQPRVIHDPKLHPVRPNVGAAV